MTRIDVGQHAQRLAVDRLWQCTSTMDAETLGHEVDWSFAAAPYDGCHTCQVREVLDAALPTLIPFIAHEVLQETVAFLRSTDAPDLSMNEAYADLIATRARERLLMALDVGVSDEPVVPQQRVAEAGVSDHH